MRDDRIKRRTHSINLQITKLDIDSSGTYIAGHGGDTVHMLIMHIKFCDKYQLYEGNFLATSKLSISKSGVLPSLAVQILS